MLGLGPLPHIQRYAYQIAPNDLICGFERP
jgi:hypothetical protein